MAWEPWDDWDRYRPRPRLPADGIRAQTQRGAFGRTWWAGRWIQALERLVNSARLARGRSYARSGQVISLEVGSDGVDAAVQGSRRRPYQVQIRFRKLAESEWDRVVEAMAARAIYAAQLLSGEMPEQIEEVFTEIGASLLPSTGKDLITSCSCPDSANPCKHIAAVHYLLGERFDADPFLMFELRGRSKERLLEELRERRGLGSPDEASPAGEAQEAGDEIEPLLSGSAAAFWSVQGDGTDMAFSFEPPPLDAMPVRRLGQPPFGNETSEFAELLEQMYRAIGDHARAIATGLDQTENEGSAGATLPP